MSTSEGGRNEQIDLVSLDIDPNSNSDYSLVSKEFCPEVGISFEMEEDAYEFYLAYAKKVGFRVRRSRSHHDKFGNFTDRLFCCSAEGKREKGKRDTHVRPARPETRFGCEARMKVSRQRDGKLHVVEFIEKHNHYLSGPSKTHFQRSHRKITSAATIQIEMTNEVGIPQKAYHDLMIRQVEGRENIGFITEDYRNHLRTKRTRDVERGDTGGVLEYLYKMQLDDPNSFYAIQVDENDLITNIFWSDAKMRAEYSNFGDVVCFDTTYRKNNEGRPLAIFLGVNHHKQMTLFGVALLYDETILTFEWLFDTFAEAMFDRRPTTILIDEDAAMAKALALRWPKTNHRL